MSSPNKGAVRGQQRLPARFFRSPARTVRTGDHRFFIECSQKASDLGTAAHLGGAEDPEPKGPFPGSSTRKEKGHLGLGQWPILPRSPRAWPGAQVIACSGGSAAGPPAGPQSLGPRSPGWRCSPGGRSAAPGGQGRRESSSTQDRTWPWLRSGRARWAPNEGTPTQGTQGSQSFLQSHRELPHPGRAHRAREGYPGWRSEKATQNHPLSGHSWTWAQGLLPALPHRGEEGHSGWNWGRRAQIPPHKSLGFGERCSLPDTPAALVLGRLPTSAWTQAQPCSMWG